MESKGKRRAIVAASKDSFHYTVYFEPQTDGSFAVVFPAFPEIVTFGRTLEEARTMARDALRCHLEGLRKDGENGPATPNESLMPSGDAGAVVIPARVWRARNPVLGL